MSRFVDQGVRAELDDGLKKRIRLTNGLSLFGAFLMFGSFPWDVLQSPPWLVFEDIIGGAVFTALPLLNRLGHATASRVLCLVFGNAIVLANAVIMGHGSGAEMAFLALASIPFAFFELREWRPLAFGVALSALCFAVAHSDVWWPLQLPADAFSTARYHAYFSLITWVVMLFSLFQTSLANARAERALREDIDRRERAEAELEKTRQSSIVSAKMAALGEMSSNIAHEINNPMTAILLRVQGLARLADEGGAEADTIKKTARSVETTVYRIRRIVDALLSFARDARKDPMAPSSVRQIVLDSVELCAQRFKQHGIRLVLSPISERLVVQCRTVQISQILLNLLSNAHDAVEKGPAPWVRISVHGDDDEVRIAVSDSGPGVLPGLEARIMEPFFTTKGVGKGTGLGLSVSKGIAESHGGRLSYDRSAAHTTFVITLPRAWAPVAAPCGGSPATAD